MRVAALSLVALAALAGCLLPQPGPRDVAGPTDGYEPTPSFLKVFVKTDAANATLVDFDRRDWYVAQIAQRIDARNLTYLSVHGQDREVLGEVAVLDVKAPADLASLRYDAMRADTARRQSMDDEYSALLARLAKPPALATPTLPSVS